MIRTLLTATLLSALLALTPVLAEDPVVENEVVPLDDIFQQLDLTKRKLTEVQNVMKQFREDRIKADRALRELSETLPPQEEISATTVYSNIVLESRLNRVLDSHQVEQIMNYLEEQRRQQNEPPEDDGA